MAKITIFIMLVFTCFHLQNNAKALDCYANDQTEAFKNIPYKSIPGVNAQFLSLDVYSPPTQPCQTSPVVVWIHGGGWSIGDKGNGMETKVPFFVDQGYVFVSINYRLSPRSSSLDPNRVKFPDHQNDAAAAIAWIEKTSSSLAVTQKT